MGHILPGDLQEVGTAVVCIGTAGLRLGDGDSPCCGWLCQSIHTGLDYAESTGRHSSKPNNWDESISFTWSLSFDIFSL